MKTIGCRLVTGLACALATGLAAAGETLLSVWAIGLPHGYIVMEHQAQQLEVTSEHVAQGYVPVTAATRFVVATRSRGDFALHFAPRGRLFHSVRIEGLGSTAVLGTQGGTLTERDAPPGRSTLTLNYRFRLAPGTAPGKYPWPLRVVAGSALRESVVAPDASPDLLTASGLAPR